MCWGRTCFSRRPIAVESSDSSTSAQTKCTERMRESTTRRRWCWSPPTLTQPPKLRPSSSPSRICDLLNSLSSSLAVLSSFLFLFSLLKFSYSSFFPFFLFFREQCVWASSVSGETHSQIHLPSLSQHAIVHSRVW